MMNVIKSLTTDEMRNYTVNQCMDSGARDYGGVVLPENGYADPTQSALAIEGLYGLYAAEDTAYSPAEFEYRIELFLGHLLSSQHDDGTLDLMSTNFHCTATHAFTVQYLYYTYLLASDREDWLSRLLADRLTEYFAKGVPALKRTLGEYLGEGVDMDESGEYTEKSVGIYNIHCNNSLMIMEECNAKLSEQHFEPGTLLTFVRRNLDLMPAYLEPDGRLFSAKSTRQDSGYRLYPDPYFMNYLVYGYMAKDAGCRETGARLLSLNEHRSRRSMESLCRLVSNREILADLTGKDSLKPVEFYFNRQFGLFRKNTETVSITVAAHTPFFFRYQKGGNSLAFRLSSSWYGEKGQFIPTSMVQRDDSTIELAWECTWGYARPFRFPPPTPCWEDMDHASREKVHMHRLEATVTVKLIDDEECALEISMDTDCRVPFKLEAVFVPGGRFSLNKGGSQVIGQCRSDEELIVGGDYTYELHNSAIKVAGGFQVHNRGAGMRGSAPLVPGALTITSTGMTPDKRTIFIAYEF